MKIGNTEIGRYARLRILGCLAVFLIMGATVAFRIYQGMLVNQTIFEMLTRKTCAAILAMLCALLCIGIELARQKRRRYEHD